MCGLLDQVRTSEEERKLVDELRAIGLDKYIELPQIAVMGDTSSGKSSLLSALSGVSFPSSDQLTTRCPTQLILTSADTFRGTVRLVRFQSADAAVNDEGEEKEELKRLEDVPDAITKLTQKLIDEGQYISDDQIVIEMSGPNLPNLTLTDLPGLVRTVGDHEDQSIIPRVREMVNRYMQQERTVIIAVVPANVDMHNTEILQAAQEADPNGTRTIAVVTKVDLVDAGAESAVHELLLNRKKHMHLGYHAVKCRSQRELTKGTSIEKGIANEMTFFGQHEYWKRLPAKLWGVPRLTERLVSILHDNIRHSLPKVITEINSRIAGTQQLLSSLGVPPPNTSSAKRQQFGKWVNQFLRLMEAAMSGQYEMFSSVLDTPSTCTNSWMSESRLRTVLRQKDLIFRANIEATTANDFTGFGDSLSLKSFAQDKRKHVETGAAVGDRIDVRIGSQETMVCKVMKTHGTDVLCEELPQKWLDASRWSPAADTQDDESMDLKKFIQANRGDELAIFPSYRIFCNCVKRSVTKWEQHAMELLEHYYTQTKSVSYHLISTLLSDSGNMRVEHFLKGTTDQVLGELERTAERELKFLLEHEARPYTQDQRLYDELDSLRQRALKDRLKAALHPENYNRDYQYYLSDITKKLGEISVGPFAMSSEDRETLEMEIALRAYLKIASHRFIDEVPMKLNGLLLDSFLREMESELLRASTDEKVAELLQESNDKALRRQQFQDELKMFEKGKQIIEKNMYW
ncbi:GTP-binding protein [Phytophthora megakarya]|uniref:GTP-binding protein n=1 Tax=Phytophthora megakarya TaxID=4795 RepID=A0A225WUB7_9STRA|nr:GTP-binding protein [Phytophthora megakarya]